MGKLGVYSYILNGVKYDMPFMEMIQSVLPIADEVHIVTDQRFNDGTIERLESIDDKRFHLHIVHIDLENPAVDGATKQIARGFCTAPELLQMDSDEVLREEDYPKIRMLKDHWPNNINIIATGVINWFNGEHIKLSAAGSVKERFTDGVIDIYHGIPIHLRIPDMVNLDNAGEPKYYYAQPDSTDGAGLINELGNPLVPQLILAKGNNPMADINNSESIWVHHYSWYSLPRKWEMKQTWHWMWGRLFGKYNSLEEYTKDLDGEPVDFFGSNIHKPSDVYLGPITDEMRDKSIVKAVRIKHPLIMEAWVQRQRVYIPKRWPLKSINKNMDSTTFSFAKLKDADNN